LTGSITQYYYSQSLTTPVLEQIPSSSSSHAKVGEASDPEDGDTEMFLEEQDLAGVDLEHLEQAYRKQELYTIPPDHLRKVHKVFLNSSVGSVAQSTTGLGIQRIQQKEQHKPQKDEKKRGRKSTQKLIQEIGHFMVNSGQIHLISDIFPPLTSPSSS
jgi:ATP-dependent exoDNAse (exonuclease V) alpha subunit